MERVTTPAAPGGAQTVIDLTAWPAAQAMNLGQGGTGGQAITRSGFLLGWSVRETSGSAAAVVVLHDGTDNSGQMLANIALVSAGDSHESLAPPGVLFKAGLYAEVVSGAVKGVAWWVPLGGA